MMFQKIGLLIAAAMCLNLSGCATQLALSALQAAHGAFLKTQIDDAKSAQAAQTHGTRIDPLNVSKIKKGVTTRSQVEALFGPPQQTTMVSDGKRMLFYNFYSSSERQTLQIILDGANVVQDHEYSTTGNTKVSNTPPPGK